MGERPAYPTESPSPVSHAYDNGTSLRYDDVRDLEDGYDRGEACSAMYHLMGDHGVISIVDPAVGAFDRSDEELASVLSVNAEIALNRLAYERTLERQNERLDEFASVVAHDLRNPSTSPRHYSRSTERMTATATPTRSRLSSIGWPGSSTT